MNGVAQTFWKEVFDLRAAVENDHRERRSDRRRKRLRRTLTNTSRGARRD
jgi:hypothetical protein